MDLYRLKLHRKYDRPQFVVSRREGTLRYKTVAHFVNYWEALVYCQCESNGKTFLNTVEPENNNSDNYGKKEEHVHNFIPCDDHPGTCVCGAQENEI